MAHPLVSDALWERIEPLLPPQKPRRFRFPGRKPLDRRKILTRIIFVLKTGIPWEELHARALGGGEKTGKNPTDRSKLGTKHHILTEAHGIPLAVTATGSNVPDVKEVLNVVDAVPPVGGKVGHPRQRPDELYADRAYDSDPHREKVKKRRIVPHFARRNTEHGSGLGIYRWVVERTASWLHSFRRLRLRTDRNGEVHEAFLALGSALICMWFL